MNRSSRITRGPDVGCNQGRIGPTAEPSRAITEAIYRSLWRDCWPLVALFAVWLICGATFA